jgi:leader peptidase (prepilin peptidase)/N-methyltransferase
MMPVAYAYPFSPEIMPVWHVMVFVLGTCLGSFLNVCIWRIPRGESVVTAPSHCPKCGHQIRWYENIPLISWLALRGKCSSCKAPITPRYFFVELLTGILFYILFFKVTFDNQPLPVLVVYLGMALLIVTTSFIDIEHRLIPDKTTYPAMLLGLITAVIFPEIWGTASRVWALVFSLAGLSISAAALALFAMFGKMLFKVEALGWGDVKYLAAVGACLGLKASFFTVLFGSIAGTLAGIIIMIVKKKGLKTAIPFGPFLAAGTYVWMVYGERLMQLYFGLFKNVQL